nr:hypothetical protein [Tanacetum cinerariifolium]
MSADEFDKETVSSNGLQPKQADLSCVHALNEPHLREIHVVPIRRKSIQKLCVHLKLLQFHVGRYTSLAAGTSRTYTSGAIGNNSGKQRTVICYNCKGEGHMSKQCTKPKNKRDESWFKDKVLLVQAQANEHLKGKESLMQTVTLLKNDFQKEESRNIYREIALEKQIKDLNNIVFKRNQSAQTVHMLTKPWFFYDHTTKQAPCFQNLFYLKKAQQLEPKLYDGNVIQKTNAIVIRDFEGTLMLAEESCSKMLLKQKDPMMSEKKVNTKPVDYAVFNQLS